MWEMPQPGDPRQPSSTWREFWTGLTRPSWSALGLTLAVAVLLFLLAARLVTPGLVSEAGRYLAEDGADDYAFATAHAIDLAEASPQRPTIVVVGASCTRDGLLREGEFADLVGGYAGTPVKVVNLTTGGQTLWESAALLDQLAPDFQGVVVVGVSPVLMRRSPAVLAQIVAQPRLGIVSDVLDAEAERLGIPVPPRIGVYLWDQRPFLLGRVRALARNLMNGPVRPQRHQALGRRPLDPRALRERVTELWANLDVTGANFERHLATLGRVLDSLQVHPGVRVVIAEAPASRSFRAVLARGYEEHVRQMRAFGRERRVPYWNVTDAVREGDYYDYCHLRTSEGQRRFTDALARRLAPMLRKLGS
jgi:hypothetical protein